MSNDGRFSRRKLLAGLGASPAFLPILEASRARAATTAPRRFIAVAWPEGVQHRSFWPSGSETAFNISTAEDSPLKPLIPHQKDIIVLGGLNLSCFQDVHKGGGHGAKPALLTGSVVDCPCAPNNEARVSAGGPSVDQFVADELQKRANLPFHSLVLQTTYWRPTERYVSFRGAPLGGKTNAPTPETDVFKLFDSLFKGRILTTGTMVDVRARRKSVLDFVGRNLTALSRNLGTDDRQKIEQHQSSIREIERQLDAVSGEASLRCSAPPAPDRTKGYVISNPADGGGAWQSPLIPEIQKLQIDMTVAAMACDLTRVATLLWGDAWNIGYVFWWLGTEFTTGRDGNMGGYGGLYRHHHEIGHSQGDTTAGTRRKNLVDQWFMSQFAYLIEKLKSVREGDGTLFDNTLAWMANIFADAPTHVTSDMPWVLAGSCGGYFKTGRYLRYASGKPGTTVPHNGLLAQIAAAMECPVATFGDPKYHVDLPRIRG